MTQDVVASFAPCMILSAAFSSMTLHVVTAYAQEACHVRHMNGSFTGMAEPDAMCPPTAGRDTSGRHYTMSPIMIEASSTLPLRWRPRS